ncbi:MAG: hypothetical protein NDJ90_11755, partial [Oligoflexia bacterium]|nr:hypothetical protein [Oligoflexia bacterium]
MRPVEAELEQAWRWRQERGVFEESQAVRIFHGPGEGSGALANFAIERFGSHYWITQWEKGQAGRIPGQMVDFLRQRGAESVVALLRPEHGVPEEPEVLHGQPPEGRFEVREAGLGYLAQLRRTR